MYQVLKKEKIIPPCLKFKKDLSYSMKLRDLASIQSLIAIFLTCARVFRTVAQSDALRVGRAETKKMPRFEKKMTDQTFLTNKTR